MIPADWPSFWLGVGAWFAASAALTLALWLYYALEQLGDWPINLTAEAQARRES